MRLAVEESELMVFRLIQDYLDLGEEDCELLQKDYQAHRFEPWSSFITNYYLQRPDEITELNIKEILGIPQDVYDIVINSPQTNGFKMGKNAPYEALQYLTIEHQDLTVPENQMRWWIITGRLMEEFQGEEASSRLIFDESDATKPVIKIPADMLLAVYTRERIPQYIYFRSSTKAIKFPTGTLFPQSDYPPGNGTEPVQVAFDFIYRYGTSIHSVAKGKGFYEWNGERRDKSALEKYQKMCQYVDRQLFPYLIGLMKDEKLGQEHYLFLRNFLEDILKLARHALLSQISHTAIGFSILYLYRMGMDKNSRFPFDPFKVKVEDTESESKSHQIDPEKSEFFIPYGIDEVNFQDLFLIHNCNKIGFCRNKECGKVIVIFNFKKYLCPKCSNNPVIRARVMREIEKEGR